MKPGGYLKHLAYFLVVGLLATFTMDIAALIIVKSGAVRLGAYRIIPELLGRWVGSFASGRVVHSTILETLPLSHEKALGLLAHYLIGLTLTSLLLFPHVRIWRRQITLRTAVFFGLATCVFPWFLMFPAMGFGVMASRLPHPSSLMLFSTLNHAAFGVGIFFWSNQIPISGSRRPEHCEESFGAVTRPEVTTS